MLRAVALATVAVVIVGAVDQPAVGANPTGLPRGFVAATFAGSFPATTMAGHAGHVMPGMAFSPTTGSSSTSLPSGPTAADAWGAVTTFRTPDGGYASPIHIALLPDGRVVMVGVAKPTPETMLGTADVRPVAWVVTPTTPESAAPAEMTIAPIAEPLDAQNWTIGEWVANDDLVCMGQALTADGRLFTVGGTRGFENTWTGQQYILGLTYATVFDGQSWTRVPADMRATASITQPARWYPTVTRLPDARMLVTGGFDLVSPTGLANLSAEIYDQSKGDWTVASAFRQTPFEIFNSDYTHQFVLPSPEGSYDVLMFGEVGVPVLMSTTTSPAAWGIGTAQPRPGSVQFQADRVANGGSWNTMLAPDSGAASAMLQIRAANGDHGYGNGTVLIAGGALSTSYAQAIDVYDPTTNQWRATTNTGIERHDASTVVLPDGRVLVINGHGADAAVGRAEYVDPLNGFAYSAGTSGSNEVRGYHSVALLLPDGRVLIGGGRDVVTASTPEKPSFRYYSPSYMFGARPRIVSAPTTLGYGAAAAVTVAGSVPTDAVLVSLGSMTHEFDSGQRSIQLPVTSVRSTADGFVASLAGPVSPRVAPPGYYMLFVLDAQRVPSVATIVQIW